MKHTTAVLTAIFFLSPTVSAGEREALYVAQTGEIHLLVDEDGDGIADEEVPVWYEKGGPETELVSLVQDGNMIYAGSKNRVWVMRDEDGNRYIESFETEVFDGQRTPRAFLYQDWQRLWIGGQGPVVEARFGKGILAYLQTDQHQLRLGPQNCRQFARHYPTQSLLCIGETYQGEHGLWIVPNTWAGLDWQNSQFIRMPKSRQWRPIGLVSDKTGVYIMEVLVGIEGNFVPTTISKLTLNRQGTGPFILGFEPLGVAQTDPSLPQPIAIGCNGMYAVFTTELGHENIVYNIFRSDGNKPFWKAFSLNLLERPTAILVQSGE